jgi:hypothetical protein
MRFGTWNVRSLYRAGSLMSVSKVISQCMLNLVAVQWVGWERRGTELTGEYKIFYRKGFKNHELGIGFLSHVIQSAVKMVDLSAIGYRT